jgi:hypothetical protein
MVSSCPELDLDVLMKRKDNVEVPQGIDTHMFFCGDNCKFVRCKVLGYAYGMRFFVCANYALDPIQPFDVTLKPKQRLTTFLNYSFVICDLIFANMSLEKNSNSSL